MFVSTVHVVRGGDEIVAGRLRELLRLNQCTTRELARVAGASESAVSGWLRADRAPKLGHLRRIARHFEISVGAIVDEADEG